MGFLLNLPTPRFPFEWGRGGGEGAVNAEGPEGRQREEKSIGKGTGETSGGSRSGPVREEGL